MSDIKRNLLPMGSTLREAIARIESSGAKIALVVDADERLTGTVTDGDIRRAILNGVDIEAPVDSVMNRRPRVACENDDRGPLMELLRRNICRHVPIVDVNGRVVSLLTLEEIAGSAQRENWVVLMAGGLGQRLRPLTEEVPKPMLRIGDRPILEIIIEGFREQGFFKFFISLNYLGDVIEDYFGNGANWGVNIEYIKETKPLGTAGALSLLGGTPHRPLVIMNGDILTKVDVRGLLQFHEDHKAQATMCVRDYHVDVPFGVIENDGHRLRTLKEKPHHRFLVNAGIYVIEPDALELIPRGEFLDMPSLIEMLLKRGQHACLFPIREYWLDVGRLDDLHRAQQDMSIWSSN